MKLLTLLSLVLTPLALAQGPKVDHPVRGSTLTLTGEIVSLRCILLDPAKGRGPDHSKCAEASIRRGEGVGFLSGGTVYVLLNVSDPKLRPVLLGNVRNEVTLTGVPITSGSLPGFELKGVESKGEAVKPTPRPKPNDGREGLKKE